MTNSISRSTPPSPLALIAPVPPRPRSRKSRWARKASLHPDLDPKQQLERYPAIEKVYEVATIKKGAKVRELPVAAKQIDPKIVVGGKSSTVDKFMTDNRITGVIAIKDGQVVLEKYALGRKPTDRWTSFSVAKSMTSTLIGSRHQGWLDHLGSTIRSPDTSPS